MKYGKVNNMEESMDWQVEEMKQILIDVETLENKEIVNYKTDKMELHLIRQEGEKKTWPEQWFIIEFTKEGF